jgi:hypothetical protein
MHPNVLGETFVREHGRTSCVLKFQGSWLLLVTGGDPIKVKPDVIFAPLQGLKSVSHVMTI